MDRREALALLLAAILACAGCGLRLEEPSSTYEPRALVAETLDLTPRRQITPILYFLNQNQTRLAAEPRSLYLGEDESAELAIVKAILEGPVSAELHPVATELAADRVEVLPDLINVYLVRENDALISQRRLTIAKLAIATALIDYSGVRYVNVLVDGRQTGYTDEMTAVTIPTGALTRMSDMADEFSSLEQKATAASFDVYAALYFLDSTETYLIPEVTRFTYAQDTDPVRGLVAMLLAGPQGTYDSHPSLDRNLELVSYEIVEEPSGLRMLRLVFDRLPVIYTSSFLDGGRMAAAALTYTLTDFIPDIDGVELAARANPASYSAYRPVDFADLLGNRVLVYLPNSPGGITMSGVERVVPQDDADDPYTRMRVLLAGPVDTDTRDVWPAAPAGVSIADVKAVYTAGDVIVVDLSGSVAEVLQEASVEDERVFVFSIVNTLTDFAGVRRILFLLDGKRTEYLGIEAICVLDPIMKDPGLIK